ncbi:MAG: diguanylate cyclase [Nitrospina sp.]|jgi:diguanylate cyclase (GGDEF)-like protein|nr:diguanylate cyclase [Nitrospina sp.]
MEGNQLKVLVVDDDDDDIFLVKELLREGFSDSIVSLDSTHSSKGAEEYLEKNEYNICILDLRLGEADGVPLLQMIKEKSQNIPVIFLTGQGDQEKAVEVMKAGAADYLIKSRLSVDGLSRSIRNAIKLKNAKEEKNSAEEALKAQDRLLNGVSKATNRLLTIQDYNVALAQALEILGVAAKVDGAFIFTHAQNAGTPSCDLEFAWTVENGIANYENLHVSSSYEELGIGENFPPLKNNQLVIASEQRGSNFPGGIFKQLKISSLLLIPIVINSHYWGFVAMGSKQIDKTWLPNEQAILETVVASIGGVIKRNSDEEAFHQIVEGTSSRVGDEFFKYLVRHLAKALPVKNAYVNETLNLKEFQCSVLAGWVDNDFIGKRSFDASDTPGEEVLAGMLAYHPNKLREAYPNDRGLAEIKAVSFAGVPCFDSKFKIIGFLSVLDDKPMLDKKRTFSILKIFAARAGAELERKKTETAMRNMAYHDSLTGLPNRILFNDRLEMTLAKGKRSKQKCAVLYIDFDGFKNINDTLGHNVGDLLLESMSARLKSCLREEDTVARLGGDEFVLILPKINSREDAGVLAKKLLETTRPAFMIEGNEIKITLSIGISLSPEDGDTVKILIKKADDALYKAKNGGRDCYKFYN